MDDAIEGRSVLGDSPRAAVKRPRGRQRGSVLRRLCRCRSDSRNLGISGAWASGWLSETAEKRWHLRSARRSVGRLAALSFAISVVWIDVGQDRAYVARVGRLGGTVVKKFALAALGLIGAAGGPYLISRAPATYETVRQWVAAPTGEQALPVEIATAPPLLPELPQLPGGASWAVEGPPARLDEILRFDITPEAVVSRWPRVTTGLADLELMGYRVPLVTGAGQADLAGSLTYYFDQRRQLRRIMFKGTTGDLSALRAVLGRFGMVHRPTNDPALMVFEAIGPAGKTNGLARIRTAPVIQASDPLRRYEVHLVVDRPTG